MMPFAIATFAVAMSPVLCTVGLVQLLGIAAAAASRLAEGTRYERGGQWICITGIVVVGAMCCFTLQVGPDTSAACAVTLTLMTLIAIIDLG
jgi:hypothetical protein